MNVLATGAISIGTYITTKYAYDYAVNKATERAMATALNLSKKAANVAMERLVTNKNEEKIDFYDFEMIEIDPNDNTIIRIINVIETKNYIH